MGAYVDIAYVKLVGNMPPGDVDALEQAYPGVVAGVATAVSRMFDARLAKRYATPFVEPVPEAVRWHVAKVTTYELWQKRGYNPGSAQDAQIKSDRDDAMKWLTEAADSKDGLVELPLRETPPDASGITKGGPLGYSEASPYTWMDLQADAARAEDDGGR